MKKTLAYLLTVTIVAATFVFVGCDKEAVNTNTNVTEPTSQATQTTTTEAATTAATVAPTETPEKAAVEKNGLKVDKDGNVTDKNGNKLKADADGKITIKNDDGTTVTVDKETIKSVNQSTTNNSNKGNNNNNSNKNTSSKSNTSNTSSKSSNTSSRNSSTNTSSKSNQTTASNTTSNVSPDNKKTWHEAVYKFVTHPAETKQVWVVDQEAYSYEEPVYENRGIIICNGCGADITNNKNEHLKQHALNGDIQGGYHIETVQVQVGTKTIDVPEKGHYETKVIKEEWTEQVLVKEAGYY